MRIALEMRPDELDKAHTAAIEVLSKLAPYDARVAKALEGLLVEDYIEQLPAAVRELIAHAAGTVEEELQHVATIARTPE